MYMMTKVLMQKVRRMERELLSLRNQLSRPRRMAHESLTDVAKRVGRLGGVGPEDLASRPDEYLYGEV